MALVFCHCHCALLWATKIWRVMRWADLVFFVFDEVFSISVSMKFKLSFSAVLNLLYNISLGTVSCSDELYFLLAACWHLTLGLLVFFVAMCASLLFVITLWCLVFPTFSYFIFNDILLYLAIRESKLISDVGYGTKPKHLRSCRQPFYPWHMLPEKID